MYLCGKDIELKQYLSHIADATAFSKIAGNFFKATFATSADVVMKASGLRLEAIRVIAREQGVEIEDTACRCIDESLLAALADAHVRRMRAYFNNTRRHIAEINGDDLATFTNFCKTFKNRQSSDSTAQAWSDIDTDAIREQFIQRVHELTPKPCLEFLASHSFVLEEIDSSLSLEPYEYLDTLVYKQRRETVEKILPRLLFLPGMSILPRAISCEYTLSAIMRTFWLCSCS